MELNKRNIVVTGASGAIGMAVCKELSKRGANLILHYYSRKNRVEDLLRSIGKSGNQASIYGADLTKPEEAAELMKHANSKFGDIDALVCLSGSTLGAGNILTAKNTDWKQAMDYNLMTAVNSIQAAIPFFSSVRSRIVLTSSVRGMPTMGREGVIAYSAAKAAILTLSSTVAKDLGPNVLVNSISPGFVWSENYEKMDPKLHEGFISETILKRFIQPEEIAPAYVFLCETDVITGQNLVVDGGFSLILA